MRSPISNSLSHGVALLLVLFLGATSVDAFETASAPYRAPATGAGNSYLPVFSTDGRFVAFLSEANNLVTNDDRRPPLDLFLRDLVASNTMLVSVGSNGFGGGNFHVVSFAMSSNASVIAFESAASNLAPGDTNETADVFVRDLAAHTTTLISRNADGTASGNGPSTGPLISADGRYVIFESEASNLVTNDFNGTNDIFIHDLATHTTSLVSVNADGTASPTGPSFSPSISEDGLTVAFVSRATNLVSGVTNRAGEIYLRFVAAGTNLWGTGPYKGLGLASCASPASSPVLSADGRFVAFKTDCGIVVRYDTQRPTNTAFLPTNNTHISFFDNPRVSLGRATTETSLATSRDGRWVSCVFSNYSDMGWVLVLGEIDFETPARWPYLPLPGPIYPSHPWINYFPELVVLSTNLAFPGNTNLYNAPAASHAMSADGQRFVFIAPTELPGSGSNVLRGPSGLWFRDMATNICVLLSTNRPGQPGPDHSGTTPALSPDGALVAWDSPDPNLVEDDLNQAWDVFAREIATGELRLVSARHAGLPEQTGRALSWLTPGAVSGDGRRVAILTYDSSLDRDDTNRLSDAFVRDLAAGTNFNLGAPLMASSFGTPITNTTFSATSSVVSAQLSISGQSALFTRSSGNATDLFWHDFLTGSNRQVISAELQGYSMSPSGRYAAYAAFSGSYWQIAIRTVSRSQDPWLIGEFLRTTLLGNNPSINPVLSDGLSLTGFTYWVAFQSQARNFTADVVPGFPIYELFVFSSSPPSGTPQFRLVSYLTSASPAPGGSSVNTAFAGGASNPVFSADGRHLFFEQTGINVIYRHRLLDQDILTLTTIGTTVLTNRARPTNDLVCTACANPSVSADGRFAAYESRGAPTNIYVRDLQSGVAELVSVNATGGTPGNGRSFTPLLSWDARYVVFASKANDLVSDDTNRATDVFVRDRLLGVTHCLSRHPVAGLPGSRASSNPVMSADGRSVAFQSFADDLAPGDYNETRDIFVVRLGGGDGDGDGMDDDWEIGWFNTLARDGSGDFDGDGASDLAEFRAGTNPADGASVLRVLTLMAGGNPAQVTLLWSASPGRRYRVQHLPQIDGVWADVTGDITAASTSAFAVVAAAGNETGFYRVLLAE